MLNKNPFYFNTIKNYIIAMSHLLNDIHIIRTDENGINIKDIKVPLTYAGKTKLFYKIQKNEEYDRSLSTILPRISFIFESMRRDSTRSTLYSNTINFTSNGIDEDFQYNPIPYEFIFSASVWSKYSEDIFQMIEQICSFFDPDFNITVNEIPSLGITKDISIILNDIDVQTENEFDEDDRVITADFNFTLKGYIYKPISNSKIIKYIEVNLIDDRTQKILETIKHQWDDLIEDEEEEEEKENINIYKFEDGVTYEFEDNTSYEFN